ncbi:MAG: hypothetical protein H0T47_07115 [Planctomycetaceae bacterium]|nr:hypothetical protein [Planctomycetaceae bacterium]
MSSVRIVQMDGKHLRLSVPVLPPGMLLLVAAAVLLSGLVTTIWYGELWAATRQVMNGGGGLRPLWQVPEALVAAALLAAILFAFRGRITTTVEPERLSVRWHLGPFGKTFILPNGAIQRVVVAKDGRPLAFGRPVVLVASRRSLLPLTTCHDVMTACEVAGLVRWGLDRSGWRPADD